MIYKHFILFTLYNYKIFKILKIQLTTFVTDIDNIYVIDSLLLFRVKTICDLILLMQVNKMTIYVYRSL